MNINKYINKLIIGISLLTVMAAVLLAYFFVNLAELEKEQEHAISESNLSKHVVEELRRSSDDLTSAARSFVVTGEERYMDYYHDILAIRNGELPRPIDYSNAYWDFVFATGKKPRGDTEVIAPLLSIAEIANLTESELALINKSFKLSTALARLEKEAFAAAQGRFADQEGGFARIGIPDKKLAVSLLFSKAYFDEKAKIMKPIAELAESVDKRTEALLLDYEARIVDYDTYVAVLVALLVLGLVVIGYLVYKRSLMQIAQRQEAQQKAEAENEALNDSVINILEAVNSLSQRDLTAKAPVTEDIIGTVSDSINQLADETARVLFDVTSIANRVSSVSDTVRNQSEQVSETAKEEQESVEKMFETLFEATQTMNQVAALSERSNESAAQATKVTENALETVNSTVGGMERIRETISETEKRIKRLGERSQEISGIVNLINTISERTHVLALNASMQAAVAGEAGRGFAVVAEEVQQLAENSRNATEQISTLVNNIQIETNETINTVNKTISQVVEGSEQAQQAGAQMRETQKITSELVSQVHSIAQASEKQKEMSAHLLEAVQHIGESNERTAEQIAEQNAGTQELQEAAKALVASVNVFKLPQQS